MSEGRTGKYLLHTHRQLRTQGQGLKVPKRNRRDPDDRRSHVLKVAIEVFQRFGYAKTTVGDIARSAKVHRPVLYDLFPAGKEEIFEASLILWIDEIIDVYKTEIARLATIREKLLFCTEHWCVEGFKLTSRNPDARDAFDTRYPAVRKMYGRLAAFYAELAREAVGCSSLDLTSEEFAELLVFSLRGVRQIPSDVESMRTVVRKEMELFLAALNYRPLPAVRR